MKYRNKLAGLIWKAIPEYIIYKFIWVAVHSVKIMMVDVLLLKKLIDSIGKEDSFISAIIFILLCTGIAFADMFLEDWISEYVRPIALSKIHGRVYNVLFEKALHSDLSKYDDDQFYNDFIWSLNKVDSQLVDCVDNGSKFLLSVINIFTMGSFLLFINPVTVFFSLVPMAAVVVCGKKRNSLELEQEKETNIYERKEQYGARVFYNRQYAEEMRTTNISSVIKKEFNEAVEQSITLKRKFGLSRFRILAVQDSGYGFVQLMGLYLFLAYEALIKRSLTIGTCSAVISAIDRLNGYFYQLSDTYFALSQNYKFAEKMFVFLETENTIDSGRKILCGNREKLTLTDQICLQHVSFTYDNNPAATINDLSLVIEKGKKYAIVGRNGAGKTTLLKLLLRLYDPDQGSITFDGSNIMELPISEYRNTYGTVFQSPQLYATSLLNNIQMGTCEEKTEGEAQLENKARDALQNASMDISIEDLARDVTKEFHNNGVEFSVGQRQKIAIAREFFGDSDIILMDEAAAALDPISEKEINTLLLENFRDKTLIVVSHRLTTVKEMDSIFFIEGGKVVESGSHEQLMRENGAYAKLYRSQAEAYQSENAINDNNGEA